MFKVNIVKTLYSTGGMEKEVVFEHMYDDIDMARQFMLRFNSNIPFIRKEDVSVGYLLANPPEDCYKLTVTNVLLEALYTIKEGLGNFSLISLNKKKATKSLTEIKI